MSWNRRALAVRSRAVNSIAAYIECASAKNPVRGRISILPVDLNRDSTDPRVERCREVICW
ncbi:MAG: hypothetical protein GF334_07235 [Candidatus Altiarchaeales archaeon]|nr:hypothetical protein [Candidatus Altiarchaeales archaeon]